MKRASIRQLNGVHWIILAVCFVLAVFAEMSLFGLCGAIGVTIKHVLFGTFGLAGWIFPILFFVWLFYLFAGHRQVIAVLKAVGAFLMFWDVLALIHHLTMSYEATMTYGAEFDRCAETGKGGGILGAMIVHMLRPAIGKVGLAFLLIILAVLLFTLLTEASLFRGIRDHLDETEPPFVEERPKKPRRRERTQARQPETRPVKRRRSGNSGPKVYDVSDTAHNDLVIHGAGFEDEGMSRDSDSAFVTLTEADQKVPKAKTKTNGSSVARSPEAVELHIHGAADDQSKTSNAFIDVGDGNEAAAPAEKKAKPKKRKAAAAKTSKTKETAEAAAVVEKPVIKTDQTHDDYQFPPLSLLARGSRSNGDSKSYLTETAHKLEQTLQNFGVNVTVTDVSCGPAVTRFELQPEAGVKVSRIVALESDIKLNLAASDIRIEAPIPGKAAVGIEVPNKSNATVMLRDLLEDDAIRSHKSKIAFAAGRDIAGMPVVADIQKMPHVLIAGATGSGKSVCINTIIMSLLYRAHPDEVKLIMIDPKVVELSVYNNIPHLLVPVVTDPKKAAGALNWAVAEMTRRYQLFAKFGVRKIEEFNSKVKRGAKPSTDEDDEALKRPLPQIVIIVDELADLMMVSSKEVEDAIVRLTQLARAAGIHLVIATQRPSVNVITGLIKANMPSRIAFAVTSGVDSRTILDMNGAEKLLGRGDMLFFPSGYPKPVRVQGAFVSDREVSSVVDYVISHNAGSGNYDESAEEGINKSMSPNPAMPGMSDDPEDDRDEYFVPAGRFIIEKEKASIGALQRRFKIGFNRAARIMDQLCEAGVVGEEEGTKPRKILMTIEEYSQKFEEGYNE